MHRSLLWGVSALKFYLSKQTEFTYYKVSAGYRCDRHNKAAGRNSTNHMGNAVDIQFRYKDESLQIGANFFSKSNVAREVELDKLKRIRDEFLIKYLCAVSGWAGRTNSYRIEPIGQGTDESYSWIHIDVVKFENKFKYDNIYVNEQSSIKSDTLAALADRFTN